MPPHKAPTPPGNPPPRPSRADNALEKFAAEMYQTPPIPSSKSNWAGAGKGAIPITRERDTISDPSEGQSSPQRADDAGEWLPAPSTSHISRFKFIPAPREKGGMAQLHVVFRGPEGKGEVAEYAYYLGSRQGETIYDELRHSGHPYGAVLYPKVIKPGLPYHPLSRS